MVPFNPQKYYDSQIATIKNQLANWDFSGAAQTAANTNSNLGPWGMRVPQDLTDINGYIAKMSPEEKAQYQKLEEANKLLAAGNNGNNGLRATKSDVANNLSAQQIANNKVIGYWSNESEAFSRVINAINNDPSKIKFGTDEDGNTTISTGENPGYDTLRLTPTGQKGVYQFTTYNQVAGGNISGALIADPTTGKVAPVINAASQFAYTPGQPGSWVRNTVGGLLGGINDLFGSLGPLGTLALAYVTGGAGVAIGEALGLSGAAAAVAGNTIINTALNGGDVGKALTGSLTSLAGAEAGGLAGDFAKAGELGSFMKDNPQYASMLASAATRTAAQGGDIESAIKNATLGIATDVATSQIDGFKDLPPTVQNTVKASIQAELQGKDVNVEGTIKNAAVNGLTSYALSQNDDFKNLDPKAQTLVANQISAGLQGKDLSSEAIKWAMNQGNQEIAKAVKGTPESEINQILDMPATAEPSPTGVEQVSDQDLEQLGVGLPTEIAQTEQEVPYKTVEDLIGLSDQQTKELGFPDYETQQMYRGDVDAYNRDVAQKAMFEGMDPTELAYLNYRDQLEGQPGFSNLEDFKKYGGDYTQYLLDQPQEPKSIDELISQIGLAPEITTPETPGSETKPEYAPQDLGITPENLASYQENLQKMEEEDQLPSQWQPNEDGTYTMIGDDGSTITIDETGDIVHYTEAPEGNLPGETLPVTTSPAATTTTAPPATTTAGPTTTPVVTTPAGQPQVKDVTQQEKPGLSAEQLGYLLDMLYPSNQQQQVEEEAASPYADIDLSSPEFAGLDYLGDIGEIPQYLGSLATEEQKAKPTRYVGAGGGRGGQGGPTASELAKYYKSNVSNLSDADVAKMLKGSEGLISTFGPTDQSQPAGNPYSGTDILKGILGGTASNVESIFRGGLSTIPGAGGDIESLIRGMFGGGKNVLPTSADIRGMVPRVTEPRMETSGMETMGEAMSPVLGKGVTAASGGIKDLMRGSTFEQEMADILARSGQTPQVSQYASNLWDPNKSGMVGNQLVNLSSDPTLPASSQKLISQALENVLAGNSRAALNLVIEDPILGPRMSKYLSGRGIQAYETLPGSTLSTKRYLTPLSGGYYNPATGKWQ